MVSTLGTGRRSAAVMVRAEPFDPPLLNGRLYRPQHVSVTNPRHCVAGIDAVHDGEAGDHDPGAAYTALTADLDEAAVGHDFVRLLDGFRRFVEMERQAEVLPRQHPRGPGRRPKGVHVEPPRAFGHVVGPVVRGGGADASTARQ